MIGLQPDRGCMISLLIAVLYLAPAWRAGAGWWTRLKPLFLCGMTALLVSAATFLGLFQSYIFGVTLGAAASREQAFDLATQFSLGPAETLSYLVPGFFGWYNGSASGPYWGWIGQTPGWAATHHGVRNLNLAISTTGTAASLLALLGALALFLPARKAGEKGRGPFNDRLLGAGADFSTRQLFFGRVLLIVGGISLLLAWGYHTPFYRPLFALPLMDKWRNPLKWLEGFNFAIPVLAAFGLAHLIRSLREPSLRFFIGIFLAVVNGALILVLAATYPIAVMLAGSLQDGGGYTPTGIANAMQTLHAAAGVAVAVGLAFGLIVAGVWRGDRLQAWRMVNPLLQNLWQRALSPAHRAAFLGSLLGLLAVVQLGWVAAHFIDAVDLAHVTSDNPLLVALQAEGPQVRVAVPQPQDPLLNFFLQNQFAQDRISSIDISAASRIPEALVHFVDAFIGNPSRLWLIGGVKDVAIGEADLASLRQNAGIAANIAGADGYTLAPTGNADLPSHAIVRLRDYLAKATFFPRAEIMAKDDALLKRLNDPAWNPRAGVLLAGTGPGAAGKDDLFADSTPTQPPAAATSVNVTTYSPHRIALQLDAPSAGYVFINDAYDPDWRVEINGRPARLLRADYLLRAVAVPAGHDEVTLRYELHYRFAGFALSAIVVNDFSDGAMLLAWGVAGVALWRQRKSGRAAASARR